MYRSNLFATKQIATILEHVLFENINDRGVSCERKFSSFQGKVSFTLQPCSWKGISLT
jgi:hypothetical protein